MFCENVSIAFKSAAALATSSSARRRSVTSSIASTSNSPWLPAVSWRALSNRTRRPPPRGPPAAASPAPPLLPHILHRQHRQLPVFARLQLARVGQHHPPPNHR